MTPQEMAAKLAAIVKGAQEAEKGGPEAMKDYAAKVMLETMPEEWKKAGAVATAEGMRLAAEAAAQAADHFKVQLFTLLVRQPKAEHKCEMHFNSLEHYASENGVSLYATGETVKDAPNAPAPTQRPANA